MTETQLKIRHLGYARVSTYGQTLDAQLAQLKAQGCSKIYHEKASGTQADRRELLKLLKAIAPGDVVTVTRIDRLARSTFDLFAIVKQIVDGAASSGHWPSHGPAPKTHAATASRGSPSPGRGRDPRGIGQEL